MRPSKLRLPESTLANNPVKRTQASPVGAAAPVDIWLELLERSDPGCDIASEIDAAGRLDPGASLAQRRKRIPWDED